MPRTRKEEPSPEQLVVVYDQTIQNLSALLTQTVRTNVPEELQEAGLHAYNLKSVTALFRYAFEHMIEEDFVSLVKGLENELASGEGITTETTAKLFLSTSHSTSAYFLLSLDLRRDVSFMMKHMGKVAHFYRLFEPEIRNNPSVLAAALPAIGLYREDNLRGTLGSELPDLDNPEVADDKTVEKIIRQVLAEQPGGIYLLPASRLANTDLISALLHSIRYSPTKIAELSAEVTSRQLDFELNEHDLPQFYNSNFSEPKFIKFLLQLPDSVLEKIFAQADQFGRNFESILKIFLDTYSEGDLDHNVRLERLLTFSLKNFLGPDHFRAWELQSLITDKVRQSFPALYALMNETLETEQQQRTERRQQAETMTTLAIARALSQEVDTE